MKTLIRKIQGEPWTQHGRTWRSECHVEIIDHGGNSSHVATIRDGDISDEHKKLGITPEIIAETILSKVNNILKQKGVEFSTENLKDAREAERKHREQFIESLVAYFCILLLDEKIPLDIYDKNTGEIFIAANRKITRTLLRKVAANYDNFRIDPSPIYNKMMEAVNDVKKYYGIE